MRSDRTRLGIALPLGAFLDAVQVMPPETLELAAPLVERPDRLGVGAIEHLAPVAAHADEADVAQHAEVLRDGGLPDAQGGRDVSHRPLPESEIAQDLPAPRLGDR